MTKILLLAGLAALLAIGVSAGRIDTKIANCVTEVNGRCAYCARDYSPTFSGLKCLPSKTQSCAKFDDQEGKFCSQCYCGTSLAPDGTCIAATIPFCAELSDDQTKCKRCRSNEIDGVFGGGGQFDYGLSFDKSNCIDNLVTINPRCRLYKQDNTSCAQCTFGWLPDVTGKCVKLASPELSDTGCATVDALGRTCVACAPGWVFNDLNAFSPTSPCAPSVLDTNCYKRTTDGMKCLQCQIGYQLLGDLTCSPSNAILDCFIGGNSLNAVDGTCGTIPIELFDEDCLVFINKGDDSVCLEQIPLGWHINGCVDWDYLSETCTQCHYGFTYDVILKRCSKNFVANCYQSSGNAICLVCQKGFYLSEGWCYKNPVFSDISPTYAFGMIVNSNKKFAQIFTIPCATWNGSTCTTCTPGFSPPPFCNESAIQNCEIYDSTGKSCLRCQNGYAVQASGASCGIPDVKTFGVPFCKTYDQSSPASASGASLCSECYPKFQLSPDQTECWQELTNCVVQASKGVCSQCQDTDHTLIYSDENNIGCASMPGSFCALSYDLQTCETCQKISGAGIPLKPNKDGDEKCTTNPPLAFMINGCAIYVDSTKCKVCKQDFILATDGTCYDRQAYNGLGPNDYCIEATTQSTCSKCNPLADGGLITITVATGSFPNLGTFCLNNNNFIRFCQVYQNDDAGHCKTCSTNYPADATSVACVNAKDPNYACQAWKSPTECTLCARGFRRYIDGRCIDEGSSTLRFCKTPVPVTGGDATKCSACGDASFLNQDGKCYNLHYNFFSYDQVVNCNKLSFAQDPNTSLWSIVKCSGCGLGSVFDSNDSECDTDLGFMKSCSATRTDGLCLSCVDQYTLSYVSGTLDYKERNVANQVCHPKIANCATYDPTYSYCQTCASKPTMPGKPDYFGWTCWYDPVPIPKCLVYVRNDVTKCAICEFGFSGEQCVPAFENCSTFYLAKDGFTIRCNLCQTGFVQTIAGGCVKRPCNFCDLAYSDTLCARCEAGFNIIANYDNELSVWYSTCGPVRSQGCVLADTNGNCLRCELGNYWLRTYENCIQNSDSYTCDIGDYCILNEGTDQSPYYCTDYTYDRDQQKFNCSRCEREFGLAPDNSYCIFNLQPCGQSSCVQYTTTQTYDQVAKCDTFGSASLLNFSLFIFGLLFLSSLYL